MEHQPYESWLLSDQPLTAREEEALSRHLETCARCRRYQAPWQEVHFLLNQVPTIAPAPGFVSRWQAHLISRRHQTARRQSLVVLSLSVVIAMVLFVLLGVQTLSTFSTPVDFVVVYTYRVSALISILQALRDTFLTLMAVLPITWWAGAAAALGMMYLVWLMSLGRYSIGFQRSTS